MELPFPERGKSPFVCLCEHIGRYFGADKRLSGTDAERYPKVEWARGKPQRWVCVVVVLVVAVVPPFCGFVSFPGAC